MSCGYGGRLLGATIANVNYIGTDPATPTYEGLCGLSETFSSNIYVDLNKQGSEEFVPNKESLDFAFTSPPYFNWEKYTEEETQSYVKFPTKEEWITGYLKETFKNCFHGLKNNKYMAINIANTKNFNNLEEETIRVAKEVGFELHDTWKLALSNPNMKNKKSSFKYEPIFIFRKKN
jgi:DNA modification methylase